MHWKILLIDDHILIREALRGVLGELRADAVFFEASNYRQTIDLIEQHDHFDLILLDLMLPDRDGLSTLAELRERCPAAAIVVLSASSEPCNITRALHLGAAGYIPKSTSLKVMVGALQLVASGGIYIPPEFVIYRDVRVSAAAGGTEMSPAHLGLTERQAEVLTLLMRGKSNKAIAAMLDLTEPTVKNHITAILKALKVNSRTEAVIAAAKHGIAIAAAV